MKATQVQRKTIDNMQIWQTWNGFIEFFTVGTIHCNKKSNKNARETSRTWRQKRDSLLQGNIFGSLDIHSHCCKQIELFAKFLSQLWIKEKYSFDNTNFTYWPWQSV